MKFIVDCMLGKLAKWLKILGFDTVYFSQAEDDELLSLARREGRILLTRDTGLIDRGRPAKTLWIESEDWRHQVTQVLQKFSLWGKAEPFSRCLCCNRKLKDLSRQKAKNLVTPYVYREADTFAICPNCGRVFWQGTHHQDMEGRIKQILKS